MTNTYIDAAIKTFQDTLVNVTTQYAVSQGLLAEAQMRIEELMKEVDQLRAVVNADQEQQNENAAATSED